MYDYYVRYKVSFFFQAQTFSDKTYTILDVILYLSKHVIKFTPYLALNFKFII